MAVNQRIPQLDFSPQAGLAGFRLQRLEVLNWGTFHRHVWPIGPGGHNALLTGDIGSGKSTLVDAITTLLVPHQRITYNKAAGAEGRERTLYSYVRGEYKSEQDSYTQNAKPVSLRDENSYSVLLARFHNEGFDLDVTLAQVFWLKDGRTNPERFFVVAERPLAIAEDFSGFGSDILRLKRRLRKAPQVTVVDQFKDYATRFRHLFGIHSDKALELFNQTVSMKSVGNLTAFVRQHMLETSDVGARIVALQRAFDNLNRAHEAVLKARAQIECLRPLVADGEQHAALGRRIDELTACRDALGAWFAGHRVRLTEVQIGRLEGEIATLSRRLDRLGSELTGLRDKAESLRAGIEDHGGSRLRAIDQEVSRLGETRQRREALAGRYRACSEGLGLPPTLDETVFHANRAQAERLLGTLEQEREALDRERTDRAVDLRALRQRGEALESELDSLRGRRSNIPLRNLEIRRDMAETLGIGEEALPFAGELLQVAEEEARWQGAVERLLHNFGLSLLVPEAHYAAVARYVERTYLRGRLVYFRVRAGEAPARRRAVDPRAVARKLRISPDSPFYAWLEGWLTEHFDHVCCEDLDDFRRLPRAITSHGQIKSGGRRHEKDDRRDIHDPSQYVLGWSNEDKIQALESQLAGLGRDGQALAGVLETLRRREEALTARRDHARDLLQIADYTEIDWQGLAARIQDLIAERRAIEGSSDTLRRLRAELEQVSGAIEERTTRERATLAERGGLNERLDSARRSLEEAREQAAGLVGERRERLHPLLEAFSEAALEDGQLTLHNLDRRQTVVREHIQRQLDNARNRRGDLAERLVKQMQAYKTDYPADTLEVDASVAAVPEFAAMLGALEQEDLPRHETRFREMLKEDTINGVAMFQGQLERERQEIGEKIETINASLREIEYGPGTYICLLMDKTTDPEIRDFREELRQCLSQSLGEAAIYSEEKFLQVKAIIDRFNGREGLIDQDRRWTRKVTDVRNWFNFSASERYYEDGREKEFYSDTSGKSGGQKEKLAYTILASALAYQFGLEWNQVQSRSFRFVVIDEAFGRGSDESTRYALELFKKLNLQLLIVTPLQKIHIIEDYVRAVHFIHNEAGRNSVIRNLSVEEYRAEKARFLSQAGA